MKTTSVHTFSVLTSMLHFQMWRKSSKKRSDGFKSCRPSWWPWIVRWTFTSKWSRTNRITTVRVPRLVLGVHQPLAFVDQELLSRLATVEEPFMSDETWVPSLDVEERKGSLGLVGCSWWPTEPTVNELNELVRERMLVVEDVQRLSLQIVYLANEHVFGGSS